MPDFSPWLPNVSTWSHVVLSTLSISLMLMIFWHHRLPGTKLMLLGHVMLMSRKLFMLTPHEVGDVERLCLWLFEMATYLVLFVSLWQLERGFQAWRAKPSKDAREALIAATRTLRQTLGEGRGHVDAR